MHERQVLGRRGEDAAAAWYTERGYELIERNWRGAAGEIDLILGRGDTVVVAEVKTRSSLRFGAPIEAVTPAKATRVRRVAMEWAAQRSRRGRFRFDVASVRGHKNGSLTVEVMEGAF